MSFDLDIAKFARKANMNVEKALKGTSIKLFSAIIKSSPVDTGRFRANWGASFGNPYGGTTNSNDKSGTNAINAMTSLISTSTNKMQFTLANNLPYAHKLEFGSSTQAPQGMVRVNVARFEQILEQQAREANK